MMIKSLLLSLLLQWLLLSSKCHVTSSTTTPTTMRRSADDSTSFNNNNDSSFYFSQSTGNMHIVLPTTAETTGSTLPSRLFVVNNVDILGSLANITLIDFE